MNKTITQNGFYDYRSDIFPFFSKELGLLAEYNDVRLECYHELEGLPEILDNKQHDYDVRTDCLLVTYKDMVIGGGKIVGKFPKDRHKIPLDNEYIQLEKLFSEHNLKNTPYCEFTRFSVLKPFRSLDMLNMIIQEMLLYSIAKGYRFMFSVSSLAQARCNRLGVRSIGFPTELNIHKDLNVPDPKKIYGTLNVCISSLEIPVEWKGIKNRTTKK